MKKKIWTVYIIRTEKDRLYTGITTDMDRRFREHANDLSKGAKFFRSDKPLEVVYTETCENRSVASIREAQIKKMSRQQKDSLVMEMHNGKNIIYSRRKVQSQNLARSTRVTKKRK